MYWLCQYILNSCFLCVLVVNCDFLLVSELTTDLFLNSAGKSSIGRAHMHMRVPNTTNPSHHAPTQRGSLSVIPGSTILIKIILSYIKQRLY